MDLSMPTEYFYLRPALGTYADPRKPTAKWHIAQQKYCGTVARGGSGPRKQGLVRNVKPELAV